jgi:Superinfection immunity protein
MFFRLLGLTLLFAVIALLVEARHTTSSTEDFIASAFATLFVASSIYGFFVPTMIAFRRQHPNRWAITAVNLVFGATVIGWGIALVWSLLRFETDLVEPS